MNHWNLAQTKNNISISIDGLNATNNNKNRYETISAEKGFTISVDFPGPVLHYFEVTDMSLHEE
jgi:hypothetical protein